METGNNKESGKQIANDAMKANWLEKVRDKESNNRVIKSFKDRIADFMKRTKAIQNAAKMESTFKEE